MRSRAEIDKEYRSIIGVYGDRIHKHNMLKKEIEAIADHLERLSMESAEDEQPVLTETPPTVEDEAQKIAKAEDALVVKVAEKLKAKGRPRKGKNVP